MSDIDNLLGEWPAQDLEQLGYCPVCGKLDRKLLFDDLTDINSRCAPGKWKLWECGGCGCGYIDPRPTPESVVRAYAAYPTHEATEVDEGKRTGLKRLAAATRNSYLNRKYGTHRTPSNSYGWMLMYLLPPPLRLEWDNLMRNLPQPAPGYNRLLDVGCGNGDFLLKARDAGWDVTGIDFDSIAAATARARGLTVYTGSLADAPFPAGSFDYITANQVIEHVHDISAFLNACVNLLAPNGGIWLGTPNFKCIQRRYFGPHWILLDIPRHLAILTADDLHRQLQVAGLNDIRIQRRGWHMGWGFCSSSKLQRRERPNFTVPPRYPWYAYIALLIVECVIALHPAWSEDLAVSAQRSPRKS